MAREGASMSPRRPRRILYSCLMLFLWTAVAFFLFILLRPVRIDPVAEEMLRAHNVERMALNVGIANVTWSETLEASARQWANILAKEENCVPYDGLWGDGRRAHNNQNGRNVLWSVNASTSPSQALALWTLEKKSYDPFVTCEDKSRVCGKCAGMSYCGHYTQMVWRSTKSIGCAIVECGSESAGGSLLVCDYYPKGNHGGMLPY